MNKLKEYLIKHQISENRFAEIAKVPQATIWRIANNKNSHGAHLPTLKKIVNAANGELKLEDF